LLSLRDKQFCSPSYRLKTGSSMQHLDLSNKKIVVLCGGPSSEREVSLRSGAAVSRALQTLGAETVLVDPEDGEVRLPDGIDFIFNALHGTFGEDGSVQEILDRTGVPYTGEGVDGSRAAFDKIESKRLFVESDVPTAPYVTLRRSEKLEFDPPFVVKVPCQGSSVGIYIVKEPSEIEVALEKAFSQAETILIEKFISGRELTVGVLGDEALPIIEIRPKGGFYSYENKYTWTNRGGAAEHECPAHLPNAETRSIQEAALAAHRALDLQVYSRVDVILDENRQPQVLEVNTIPGMTETSLLPEAAAAAGISMPKLCERILQLSLERRMASKR
jgi:D-alanine-D-alanine ligase